MNDSQNTQTAQQKPLSRWWHSLLIGYPATLLLIGVAFLIPWSEETSGLHDFFIAPPFVMVTLLVTWLWGAGPALLSLVIEVLALDYWIVPPLSDFSFFRWPDLASFGPFILIQLLALGLILRQKHYRTQLFLSHQAMSRYVKELEEINQQLEQANRSRDLFLSQASHELKTPLTSLRGLVQLSIRRLRREPPLPANYSFLQANLARVEAQTNRLHALVDDLLSVNYLRSGKISLHREPCDLNQLCQETIDELETWDDHTVILRRCSSQIEIQADPDRLRQVFLNLLSNALKYSPAHSSVQVEVSRTAQEALIAVHNEGSVISAEQQQRVFEPFYRSPEVWCSANSGWGLGLAISKQLVEQHGGRIWIESSEQWGTTFYVALPFDPHVCMIEEEHHAREE